MTVGVGVFFRRLARQYEREREKKSSIEEEEEDEEEDGDEQVMRVELIL